MKKIFNRSGGFISILLILSAFSPLYSQESSGSRTVESILTEAAEYLASRNYNSALSLFDTLPPEHAQNVNIKILRANIFNAAGRPADAKRIANEIIASDSRNTDALMALADAAALENKERDRRGFLDRVIAIDPQHLRALNDLANINLKNANLRVAGNYFDRVLAVDPNNGEALVGRASVYRYNRESREAERLLNRAAVLYPAWARPFHERARLYRGAGYYSDAISDLAAAVNLEPDNYWILVDYGQTLMEVNRPRDALVYLNRAISVSPNDFMAYVYSSAIKDGIGDYAGAETDYAMLGRLKPDYYFAFEALGVIRMRNKNWAGARDAFFEAYRQAPREECYGYAILAALNSMRAGRQTDPRTFLSDVLRATPRNTLNYSMLRLLYDLSGDSNVTTLIESERDLTTKSRMLFYLAEYFDIRGSRTLAERYYLMVHDLDIQGQLEWRLNEIVLADRGLGLRNAQ